MYKLLRLPRLSTALAAIVGLAALTSCNNTETDLTSIVVEIRSELAAGTELDNVRVTVGARTPVDYPLGPDVAAGQRTFPIVFGIRTQEGPRRTCLRYGRRPLRTEGRGHDRRRHQLRERWTASPRADVIQVLREQRNLHGHRFVWCRRRLQRIPRPWTTSALCPTDHDKPRWLGGHAGRWHL